MSRKKKLQKKIAVAVSVVNILNVCAPMVLPYVNMTRDLSARGGYMEPVQGGAQFAAAGVLADAVQAVMPERRTRIQSLQGKLSRTKLLKTAINMSPAAVRRTARP